MEKWFIRFVAALSLISLVIEKRQDEWSRVKELENTDDFLIADSIVRRYGRRCKIVLLNCNDGKVACYAELTSDSQVWASSGMRRTDLVYGRTFIDAEIACSKLMRLGLKEVDHQAK